MENEKIDEMETLAEAVVEAEETKEEKVGFLSKVGCFTKKHGKKLLIGALIAGAGVIGYNKGKKLADFDDDYDYDSTDDGDISVEESVTIDEN